MRRDTTRTHFSTLFETGTVLLPYRVSFKNDADLSCVVSGVVGRDVFAMSRIKNLMRGYTRLERVAASKGKIRAAGGTFQP